MKTLQQMPLRIPSMLHQEIADAAHSEGLSINQFCLFVLTKALAYSHNWMSEKGESLLHFLNQAKQLQSEFNKNKNWETGKTPIPETPFMRLKKIYGKNRKRSH